MTTVKEIFQTYAPEYIQRFGDDMPGKHQTAQDCCALRRPNRSSATQKDQIRLRNYGSPCRFDLRTTQDTLELSDSGGDIIKSCV